MLTDAWGQFQLPAVPSGDYAAWVKGSNTLAAGVAIHFAPDGGPVDLGTLRSGDANGDNYITMLDFSTLVTGFGVCEDNPSFDPRPDFNGDACVTMLDFSLLVLNFGQAGAAMPDCATEPVPLRATAAPPGPAELVCVPEWGTVAVGETFDAALRVDAPQQLVDGVEAHLNFDPAVLRVVFITPGTDLPVVVQNDHDNTAGTIDYAAGAFSDLPSGAFTFATVRFEALGCATETTIAYEQYRPRASDVTCAGESVFCCSYDGVVTVVARTPELVGLSPEVSGDVLDAAGLVLGAVAEAYSANTPAGLVLAQDPVPETLLDCGASVDVTVSAGPVVYVDFDWPQAGDGSWENPFNTFAAAVSAVTAQGGGTIAIAGDTALLSSCWSGRIEVPSRILLNPAGGPVRIRACDQEATGVVP